MIRYELRKYFIYNKIWILLLIVISGIILRSLIPNQQLKSLDNQNYQFYYEKLNGKINQDKIAFLKNEENNINQFKEKSNLLETLYKEGKISDEEYINQLEKINTYHYRAQTFEDINDYVNYLKENKTMLYTVVGADEVKDVVQLIKALDPHVFINIINSEGVTGRFYQEPIE